jgi:hypothetical protein
MRLVLSAIMAVLVLTLVVVSVIAQNAINNSTQPAPSTITIAWE